MFVKKIPFVIAIAGMVGGIFIAILFGINEHIFKDKISRDLSQNVKIEAMLDPAKKDSKIAKEKSKLWRYYQRFHFHSTGIGSMSLALLIFLAFVQAPARLKLGASYMTAVGGFFYPFVWLFAGLFGGVMGRTEAKEAFAIFGYCGGLFLIGTLAIMYMALKYPLKFPSVD